MRIKEKKYIFDLIISVYFIIYCFFFIVDNYLLLSILNPMAAFLTLLALQLFLKVDKKYISSINFIKLAFLIWMCINIYGIIFRVIKYKAESYFEINKLYNFEKTGFVIVIFLIYISSLLFYITLSKNFNKFQRFADLFTVFSCVFYSLWIIFEHHETGQILLAENGLNLNIFIAGLINTISLMILGVLLISWLHFQYMKITIGQRSIIGGVAVLSFVSLLKSLEIINIDIGHIAIIYIVSSLMIASGATVYTVNSHKLIFGKIKNEEERLESSWRNWIYLFTYPVFLVLIVGFQFEILFFIFIIAFYLMACKYVKQIAVTEKLLKNEQEKNHKLKIYSNVLEKSPLSVVITDVNGNIEYVNPFFQHTTGYSSDEIIGKNPRILKSKKTPQSVYDDL